MRVGVSGIGKLQPGCAAADRAGAGAAALGAAAGCWTGASQSGRSGTVLTVVGQAPVAAARPPAGAPGGLDAKANALNTLIRTVFRSVANCASSSGGQTCRATLETNSRCDLSVRPSIVM